MEDACDRGAQPPRVQRRLRDLSLLSASSKLKTSTVPNKRNRIQHPRVGDARSPPRPAGREPRAWHALVCRRLLGGAVRDVSGRVYGAPDERDDPRAEHLCCAPPACHLARCCPLERATPPRLLPGAPRRRTCRMGMVRAASRYLVCVVQLQGSQYPFPWRWARWRQRQSRTSTLRGCGLISA